MRTPPSQRDGDGRSPVARKATTWLVTKKTAM
jgi:hypothetical protein